MSDLPSLLGLFDNKDKERLIETLIYITQDDAPIPVQDIVEILEETIDIEIVAALVETLMYRVDDVADQLMEVEYKKASKIVKNHIVMVLSNSDRSKYMQFLLDEYFYNPYMRPVIRQYAFENKKFLFMNLVRYFEAAPFNTDNVEISQQILKMIPRDIILSSVVVFTGTKLLDVYYAIPVDEREKFDE